MGSTACKTCHQSLGPTACKTCYDLNIIYLSIRNITLQEITYILPVFPLQCCDYSFHSLGKMTMCGFGRHRQFLVSGYEQLLLSRVSSVWSNFGLFGPMRKKDMLCQKIPQNCKSACAAGLVILTVLPGRSLNVHA